MIALRAAPSVASVRGPANCTSSPNRFAKLLPLRWADFDRQHFGERRTAKSAGPKAVITADHDQSHALLHALRNRLPTRGVESLHIDVVDHNHIGDRHRRGRPRSSRGD